MTLRLLMLTLAATLVLAGCASTDTDRRGSGDLDSLSMGAAIDDSDLESRIRSSLASADDRFEDAPIKVVSHNARVLVTGRVPEESMIETATEVVRDFRRVRFLHNELVAGDPLSMDVRSSDQWLSIRVKGRLVTAREFPSRRVVITTENGVVYLMGLVTQAQGEQAEQLTAGTDGVQRVVSIFDYTD